MTNGSTFSFMSRDNVRYVTFAVSTWSSIAVIALCFLPKCLWSTAYVSDEIGYQCLLYNQAGIQRWKCTTYFSISLLGVSQRGTSWVSVTVLTVHKVFLGFCQSTHLPSPWAQKLLQCSLVPVVPICTVPHCKTEVCIFSLSLYLPCLTELSCCSQHTHFQIHFKLCPFIFCIYSLFKPTTGTFLHISNIIFFVAFHVRGIVFLLSHVCHCKP